MGGLNQHGRWMAAVLSCGPSALLSHSSAAALWGFGPEWGGGIEVATRSASPRERPGVRVHRRPSLRPVSVSEHDQIPVTSPVQTLIDLAARWGPRSIERAVSDADRLSLVTPPALRAALEDHRGEPGVTRLRERLDRRTFRLTRSDLEQIFLPIAAEGRPCPLPRSILPAGAGVAELAYAIGSKSIALTGLWVRVPPPASPFATLRVV